MLKQLKITNRCISCDNCRLICPENSVFVQSKEYFIDNWSCTFCKLCVEICPVDCIKEHDDELDIEYEEGL